MSIPSSADQLPLSAHPPGAIRGRDLVAGTIGAAVGATLTIGIVLLPIVVPELPQISAGSPFTIAIDECGASGTYVLLLDDGTALEMSTAGEETPGAEYEDVACILNELGMSETILSRIGTTRAMDGRQEGSWDGYVASWTYHPDDGLSILIEIDTKN
ncbi:hypothetical protein [Microbacterium profundi]|uniref:hypothetical protein n=1 Tax=Microbacterium profundi TaxID=450380 RepID=UPI00051A2C06|nr:hypothetical protein [Microbacterium profundi]